MNAGGWTFFGYGIPRNYSIEQIPDLTGKVALVTGGSRGIGFETSAALAGAGAKVYIASKSQEKGEQAIAEIRARHGGEGDLFFLETRLQSIKAAKEAAESFLKLENRLDILVLNAGMTSKNELSEDGIELSMAIDHVGHHVLTTTLLPLILQTASTYNSPCRIVGVSSHSHYDVTKPEDWDLSLLTTTETPTAGAVNDFLVRYSRAKLANVLFIKHLANLLETSEYKSKGGDKVFANSCHPGMVVTDIQTAIGNASSPWIGNLVWFVAKGFGISQLDGAMTQLFLATSPKVEEKSVKGKYFCPIAVEYPTNKLVTNERAEELWKWTESQKQRALAK